LPQIALLSKRFLFCLKFFFLLDSSEAVFLKTIFSTLFLWKTGLYIFHIQGWPFYANFCRGRDSTIVLSDLLLWNKTTCGNLTLANFKRAIIVAPDA
jgi:hypothetical protein